jgi:undecaprenyl pyrophosphate synthase
MLISSEEEEEIKPPRLFRPTSHEVYTPSLELVRRPSSEVHVPGRMMEIVMESFERRMREAEAEKAEIARNPVVRKTDPKLVREIEELKKEFPSHSYLPVEALK